MVEQASFPHGNPSGRRKPSSPPALSMTEAAMEHPAHWIVMQVTKFDEYHLPAKGYILYANKRQGRAVQRMLKLAREDSAGEMQYFVFEGQPYIQTGAEARRHLTNLERHDELTR